MKGKIVAGLIIVAVITSALIFSGCVGEKHYVRFVLTDFGKPCSNVNADAYVSDNDVAILSGTTGTDGAVVWKMSADVSYRIVFTNTSQGIDKTITIYPTDNAYYVSVDTPSAWSDYKHARYEEIHTTVKKRIINDTHVYINVTYKDDLNGTTALKAEVKEQNIDDPRNPTILSSHNFTGDLNDTAHSFIVPMLPGQAYFVDVWQDHIEFGQHTYSRVLSYYHI